MHIKAQAPSAGNSATIVALALTVMVGMVVALGVWYSRRRPAITPSSAPLGASDVLVAQLASLDARFEKLAGASAEDRSRHARARAALKEKIAESLARESTPA